MTAALPPDVEPEELAWFARWKRTLRCPPPELLGPALEGGILPAALESAVRLHISRCRSCEELARLQISELPDLTSDDVTRLRARIEPAAPARPAQYWMAAAATLILIAGGAAMWVRAFPRIETPHVAAPQQAAREVRPEFALALAQPELELPPEALGFRSDAAAPYALALDRALASYEQGNYRDAAARFERIAAENPGKPHPSYYLGLARLFGGAPADAVPALQEAQRTSDPASSLRAHATWYLAVSLERAGRGDAALAPLLELCGSRRAHDADACEGLHSLLTR